MACSKLSHRWMNTLQQGLEQLVRADILYQRGLLPQPNTSSGTY